MLSGDARQEASKRRLGDREKLFLHLHHHETRAGSGTLIGIARQYIAGGKIRHVSAESLTRDYRRWRRTVKAHPAGDKLHRSPADPYLRLFVRFSRLCQQAPESIMAGSI